MENGTTQSANCRVFKDEPTIEWAIFIRNNRDRKFADYDSLECNLDCKYDVVVGPVADDTSLKYLKKVGAMYDERTAGND